MSLGTVLMLMPPVYRTPDVKTCYPAGADDRSLGPWTIYQQRDDCMSALGYFRVVLRLQRLSNVFQDGAMVHDKEIQVGLGKWKRSGGDLT